MEQIDNRIGLDEAFAHTLNTPELLALYRKHCALFQWPERDLNRSPQWADWFARQVLSDHWPAAEELIATDQDVEYGYRNFTQILEQTGMKGYSTGDHEWARIRRDLERGLVHARTALRQGANVDRISDDVDRFMRSSRRTGR